MSEQKRRRKRSTVAPVASAVKAALLQQAQSMVDHPFKMAKWNQPGFMISLKEFLQMKQDVYAVKQ